MGELPHRGAVNELSNPEKCIASVNTTLAPQAERGRDA